MSQKRALAQEIDLVHQTVSPRERVGSGHETSYTVTSVHLGQELSGGLSNTFVEGESADIFLSPHMQSLQFSMLNLIMCLK